MALRTHLTQTKIGCPGVAEFTVQRTEALFDHITGLRQISVAFGLRFRQRTVAAGFAHNAVQQPMFFQMLPVFLTVIAFVGIDGRTFGNAFQFARILAFSPIYFINRAIFLQFQPNAAAMRLCPYRLLCCSYISAIRALSVSSGSGRS